MKAFKLIIIVSLFSIVFSCQESRTNFEKEQAGKVEDDLLEFDLSKMGEILLDHTYTDRIRIIQYNPFGMKTYIVNVGKYSDGYSISSKIVTITETGYEYIDTTKTRKKELFNFTWDNALKKLSTIIYEKLENNEIGDRATAMIESNIGGVYKIGDFIFCDSTKWITDIMRDLTEGSIGFDIPYCVKTINSE